MFVVIRTAFTDHGIYDIVAFVIPLDHFLQDRLAVCKQFLVLEVFQDEPPDKCFCLVDASIQEDRSDQRFQRV